MGQEGERKQGGEKGDDGRGGREGKGEKGRKNESICLGVALSVGKYLSNSFHSVKTSLLLSFLQTLCLLIFYCLLLYLPSISTFHNLLILCAFSHSVSSLKVFSDSLYRCSLDPLLCFPSLLSPSSPPPPLLKVHPSSCCSVAQAFQGLLYGCMCEEGRFFPWGRR